MQNIEDKDFDQFFKNKFEDVEITPSRNLWPNIESELKPKHTRKISVLWWAAAIALIVSSITLFKYNFTNDDASTRIAEVIKPKENVIISNDHELKPIENASNKQLTAVVEKPKLKKVSVPIKNNPVDKTSKMSTEPVQQKSEMMAKAEQPAADLLGQPVNINDEILIANLDQSKLSLQNEVEDSIKEEDQKGIRNVGDIVNLVINKLDKRKDKLIQFKTQDDDSSIASINIGPFKFGNKNKNK